MSKLKRVDAETVIRPWQKSAFCLATSDNLQGLVAQGRTIAETMEIAQDVARKLIESFIEFGDPLPEEVVPPARVVKNIKIPVVVSV